MFLKKGVILACLVWLSLGWQVLPFQLTACLLMKHKGWLFCTAHLLVVNWQCSAVGGMSHP
jgi:hypothetical protein